ncbi:MAG: hypothetical protein ACO1QS_11755 [Verrucomicrobiota bacterium]
MKIFSRFFSELVRQPAWIPFWVVLLMLVNLGSAVYWSELTARLIFITFMLSAGLLMGLYAKFGYSKILGAAHILWIPLLPWVLFRLDEVGPSFRAYLLLWAGAATISLAFDLVDVWKYYKAKKSA